ncbi:hypothetical protein FQA47_001341 [Oryzias melastigma]|uniref:Uncharacterized protein n=1 Tax=Oryzias melastigma TaxID=30732 RepID=A0A834KX84_ORYME|nr:hypothetical protein FQA47_001341 [Oryzias melastigma]
MAPAAPAPPRCSTSILMSLSQTSLQTYGSHIIRPETGCRVIGPASLKPLQSQHFVLHLSNGLSLNLSCRRLPPTHPHSNSSLPQTPPRYHSELISSPWKSELEHLCCDGWSLHNGCTGPPHPRRVSIRQSPSHTHTLLTSRLRGFSVPPPDSPRINGLSRFLQPQRYLDRNSPPDFKQARLCRIRQRTGAGMQGWGVVLTQSSRVWSMGRLSCGVSWS